MNVMEFLQAMDNVEANRFRKADLRKFYDKLDVETKKVAVWIVARL